MIWTRGAPDMKVTRVESRRVAKQLRRSKTEITRTRCESWVTECGSFEASGEGCGPSSCTNV